MTTKQTQSVDKFTRMVQAGKITPAQARERRRQSLASKAGAGGGFNPPTTPSPRVRNPVEQGWRREEVWNDWIGPSIGYVEYSLAPVKVVNNPPQDIDFYARHLQDLDHKFVQAMYEIRQGFYDGGLMRYRICAGLYRWEGDGTPRGVVPPNTNMELYQGGKAINLESGGPIVRWAFTPRAGDRVSSLDGGLIPLHLGVRTDSMALRPPSGDEVTVLEPAAAGIQVRFGGIWMVRDRKGFLL